MKALIFLGLVLSSVSQAEWANIPNHKMAIYPATLPANHPIGGVDPNSGLVVYPTPNIDYNNLVPEMPKIQPYTTLNPNLVDE